MTQLPNDDPDVRSMNHGARTGGTGLARAPPATLIANRRAPLGEFIRTIF
jgi:hypothetical protein